MNISENALQIATNRINILIPINKCTYKLSKQITNWFMKKKRITQNLSFFIDFYIFYLNMIHTDNYT